jgi:hypothetical protein
MPALHARRLQVALKLIIDCCAHCRIPLATNAKSGERCIVCIGKIVAFTRESKVERSPAAAHNWR